MAPPVSERVPADDPAADRGVLLPTAYTHPKGTWFISNYDIVLSQMGYAFTDDTQLSVTGFPPVGQEMIGFADLTLKTSLYRGGRVRVAGLGSVSSLFAKEVGVLGIGRAGGVVQLCIDGKCDSSVSMSTNFTLAGAMLMANGVSGIFRTGRTVSLLAEMDTLVPLVRDSNGEFGGAMAGGGVRIHGATLGLDLALMHVIGKNKPTLPLVALTWHS
jgi:hypothetical protein